jgi:hypothetical protein
MAKSKEKKGFLSLTHKIIAVISASVTSLAGGQSQAAEIPAGIQNADTNIEFSYSSPSFLGETELYRAPVPVYVTPTVYNTYSAIRSGKSVKYIFNTDSAKIFYKGADGLSTNDVKVEEITLKKVRPLRH